MWRGASIRFLFAVAVFTVSVFHVSAQDAEVQAEAPEVEVSADPVVVDTAPEPELLPEPLSEPLPPPSDVPEVSDDAEVPAEISAEIPVEVPVEIATTTDGDVLGVPVGETSASDTPPVEIIESAVASTTATGTPLWLDEVPRFFDINVPVVLFFPYHGPQSLLQSVTEFISDSWDAVVIEPIDYMVSIASDTIDMVLDTITGHVETPGPEEVRVDVVEETPSTIFIDDVPLDASSVAFHEEGIEVSISAMVEPGSHTLSGTIDVEGEQYRIDNFTFVVGGEVIRSIVHEHAHAIVMSSPDRGPEIWIAHATGSDGVYEYVAPASGITEDSPMLFKDGMLFWATGGAGQGAFSGYNPVNRTVFSQSLENEPQQSVELPSADYLIEREGDQLRFQPERS